jgi:hypothetical protein
MIAVLVRNEDATHLRRLEAEALQPALGLGECEAAVDE